MSTRRTAKSGTRSLIPVPKTPTSEKSARIGAGAASGEKSHRIRKTARGTRTNNENINRSNRKRASMPFRTRTSVKAAKDSAARAEARREERRKRRSTMDVAASSSSSRTTTSSRTSSSSAHGSLRSYAEVRRSEQALASQQAEIVNKLSTLEAEKKECEAKVQELSEKLATQEEWHAEEQQILTAQLEDLQSKIEVYKNHLESLGIDTVSLKPFRYTKVDQEGYSTLKDEFKDRLDRLTNSLSKRTVDMRHRLDQVRRLNEIAAEKLKLRLTSNPFDQEAETEQEQEQEQEQEEEEVAQQERFEAKQQEDQRKEEVHGEDQEDAVNGAEDQIVEPTEAAAFHDDDEPETETDDEQ